MAMSEQWIVRLLIAALITLLMLLVLSAAGCANLPTTEINAQSEIATQLTGQSVQRIDKDGNLVSSTNGVPGSLVNQDERGQWTAQGGPLGLMSVNPTTGVLTIASPKDVRMTGVRITPNPNAGEPFFEAATLEANITPAITALVDGLKVHIGAIVEMNRDEAQRYVDSLVAVGEITATVAQALAPLIASLPPGIVP